MAAPLRLNMQGYAAQPCQLPGGTQHYTPTGSAIAPSSTRVVAWNRKNSSNSNRKNSSSSNSNRSETGLSRLAALLSDLRVHTPASSPPTCAPKECAGPAAALAPSGDNAHLVYKLDLLADVRLFVGLLGAGRGAECCCCCCCRAASQDGTRQQWPEELSGGAQHALHAISRAW